MPHIDIIRTHHLGLAGARQAAEAVAADLRAQYRARTDWDGDTLRLSGPGVKGDLHVTDSTVRVTANLGLALRPLRRQLEREIEGQLDQSIGAPRTS